MEQIRPFGAEFHFGEMVTELERTEDGFRVRTDANTTIACKVVVDRRRRRLVPAEAPADPRHRGL